LASGKRGPVFVLVRKRGAILNFTNSRGAYAVLVKKKSFTRLDRRKELLFLLARKGIADAMLTRRRRIVS